MQYKLVSLTLLVLAACACAQNVIDLSGNSSKTFNYDNLTDTTLVLNNIDTVTVNVNSGSNVKINSTGTNNLKLNLKNMTTGSSVVLGSAGYASVVVSDSESINLQLNQTSALALDVKNTQTISASLAYLNGGSVKITNTTKPSTINVGSSANVDFSASNTKLATIKYDTVYNITSDIMSSENLALSAVSTNASSFEIKNITESTITFSKVKKVEADIKNSSNTKLSSDISKWLDVTVEDKSNTIELSIMNSLNGSVDVSNDSTPVEIKLTCANDTETEYNKTVGSGVSLSNTTNDKCLTFNFNDTFFYSNETEPVNPFPSNNDNKPVDDDDNKEDDTPNNNNGTSPNETEKDSSNNLRAGSIQVSAFTAVVAIISSLLFLA